MTARSYDEALDEAPEARGLVLVEDPEPEALFVAEDLDEDGEVIILPGHPDDLREAYWEGIAEARKEARGW